MAIDFVRICKLPSEQLGFESNYFMISSFKLNKNVF